MSRERLSSSSCLYCRSRGGAGRKAKVYLSAKHLCHWLRHTQTHTQPASHHTSVNTTSHHLIANKRAESFPGPQVDTCHLRRVPFHNGRQRYKTQCASVSVSLAGGGTPHMGAEGRTDGGAGHFARFLGALVIPQSLRQCLEQSGIFCSLAELHMLALGD